MQHSLNNQINIHPVQSGQTIAQIHRNTRGDTRRDPQYTTLAARARQPTRDQRLDRSRPVDSGQQATADQRPANPHEPAHELVTAQPTLMPDQQLDSRLSVIEPSRMRPQPRREVLDTGSKSVLPSTKLIMTGCSARSGRFPPGTRSRAG